MLSNLKNRVSAHLINYKGWSTNRKIVVIESDDWGTIRMSSKEAFNSLLKKGYPVDQCPYNKNDALESNQDLEMLFDVLNSVKGNDGNPVILTANNIVANPDFEKIKKSNFKEYHFEPFTETLKHYPEHDRVMDLYREGINSKLIMPQFHGREHLNVTLWMKALQRKSEDEMVAFDLGIFSSKVAQKYGYQNEYMDAFDFKNLKELEFQEKAIVEGLKLFKHIWNFNSESFIAPCYIWHSQLEKVLKENGVKYIQGLINQFEPKEGDSWSYSKKYHYQGQKNSLGQRYLIRNAFFEPTINPKFDWESDCLKRMEIIFKLKKPVIISTHRINFIGSLNPKNREDNLKRFQSLLNQIIKKWPDVQFMSTDQLGNLINK